MDIKTLVGKHLCIVLVSNDETNSITGLAEESDFGDDVITVTDDDDPDSYLEIPLSSIAYFYEVEEKAVEEKEAPDKEPAEELPASKKDKYSNRSIDEIPTKKKKGWLGF